MASKSELDAHIAGCSADQLSLYVVRQLCPGCNGNCGVMTLTTAADAPICVSTAHLGSGARSLRVGEQVSVAIPSITLISLSLLVYLTPLLLMLLSSVACFEFYSESDAVIAVCASVGFFSGLITVRLILGRLEQGKLARTLRITAK